MQRLQQQQQQAHAAAASSSKHKQQQAAAAAAAASSRGTCVRVHPKNASGGMRPQHALQRANGDAVVTAEGDGDAVSCSLPVKQTASECEGTAGVCHVTPVHNFAEGLARATNPQRTLDLAAAAAAAAAACA